MLEITLIAILAWLLLAAASFRFRRPFGIASPAAIRGLRVAAAALLVAALLRGGTAIDGERWVRFLGGASLAAVIVVLSLSVAPVATMRPLAARLRRRPAR